MRRPDASTRLCESGWPSRGLGTADMRRMSTGSAIDSSTLLRRQGEPDMLRSRPPCSSCRTGFARVVHGRGITRAHQRGGDGGRCTEDRGGRGRNDGRRDRASVRGGRLSGECQRHCPGAARPRHGGDQEEPRSPHRARQVGGRRQGRGAWADQGDDGRRGSRRLRRRHRSGYRAVRPEESRDGRSRPRLPARRDPRHQHIVDFGHPHRRRPPRRPPASSACISSTPCR